MEPSRDPAAESVRRIEANYQIFLEATGLKDHPYSRLTYYVNTIEICDEHPLDHELDQDTLMTYLRLQVKNCLDDLFNLNFTSE